MSPPWCAQHWTSIGRSLIETRAYFPQGVANTWDAAVYPERCPRRRPAPRSRLRSDIYGEITFETR
jgi:hypothetical protein